MPAGDQCAHCAPIVKSSFSDLHVRLVQDQRDAVRVRRRRPQCAVAMQPRTAVPAAVEQHHACVDAPETSVSTTPQLLFNPCVVGTD